MLKLFRVDKNSHSNPRIPPATCIAALNLVGMVWSRVSVMSTQIKTDDTEQALTGGGDGEEETERWESGGQVSGI